MARNGDAASQTMMRVRRAVVELLGLTFAVLAASAHIGSPDVWLEGKAGPYPVVVNVQVPGVVPGIAQVYVRVTGDGVQQVSASSNKFDATAGSPPPDVARPVDGDPSLYHVPLWIMTPGSNSVTVYVRGTRGEGALIVPAVVVANQRLTFGRPMAIGLGAIGILLFLGAISIFGATTREAVLAPGVTPDRVHRRRGRLVMTGTAVLLSVVLFGGWSWWNAEDQRFAETLYKPMVSRAILRTNNGATTLDFSIVDSSWTLRHDTAWFRRNAISLTAYRNASALTPLVPDHGKLMHLVLIREPDMTVFAHLHPTTTDSVTFSTAIPTLPGGHYRIFADIVLESGDAETMTTTVDIPGVKAVPDVKMIQTPAGSDSDNSWYLGKASEVNTAILADGSVMHWERGTMPLLVGRPAPLIFTVTDAAGRAVILEPYMGMASHTMVMRDDDAVFVHLHPTGTVSMGAQQTFALRQPTDTVSGMVAQKMKTDSGMASMPMSITGNTVRLPYAFPKAGHYHIWVQVKHAGQILTGAFQTAVAGQ
jgi:hypothetical protein